MHKSGTIQLKYHPANIGMDTGVLFVVHSAAPVADDRAMAGNSALGRNLW